MVITSKQTMYLNFCKNLPQTNKLEAFAWFIKTSMVFLLKYNRSKANKTTLLINNVKN